MNDWSFDPREAAAIICTAQPQSIEAIDAIEPTVLASAKRHYMNNLEYKTKERVRCLQPTIHARRFLHRGDDSECVQKYN